MTFELSFSKDCEHCQANLKVFREIEKMLKLSGRNYLLDNIRVTETD